MLCNRAFKLDYIWAPPHLDYTVPVLLPIHCFNYNLFFCFHTQKKGPLLQLSGERARENVLCQTPEKHLSATEERRGCQPLQNSRASFTGKIVLQQSH